MIDKVSIGAWCTVGNSLVVEAMLSVGVYDWLAVDDEHCAFDESSIIQIMQVCDKHSVRGMVRLRNSDPILARKALDFGAKGILVPMAESAEQIRGIAEHIYYPPKGRRGMCLARINSWGTNFDKYLKEFKPLLIAQIESQKGLQNLEEILRVPEVDGIFLGPYDLSGSLGSPGNFTTPDFTEAVAKAKSLTVAAKKILGIHVVEPEPEQLKARQAEGFNFIAYSTDLIAMRHSILQLKTAIST